MGSNRRRRVFSSREVCFRCLRLQDLLEAAAEGYQVVAVDPSYQTEDSIPALRNSLVSGLVNVIYGCNERCTYCVVPNTRGVEQSRSKDAVLAEIASLVAAGVPEVTLLGQNIDSWGRLPLTPCPTLLDFDFDFHGISLSRRTWTWTSQRHGPEAAVRGPAHGGRGGARNQESAFPHQPPEVSPLLPALDWPNNPP